ncbi:hypothetical protein HMPREF1982_02180 [Clostridiales bacterium oral taxon 876 str. F0540]|nr:hypothetical protein HMPREF1982_02180 [Clostridiales bacterium oral taxon 876 str. F0540]
MEYKGGGSVAGINNIVGAYSTNPKRVASKLSFEVGQVFSARISAVSEQNMELILKLLDGWQFPAKLQQPLNFVPDGLAKFQVEGFKDGKLQIKLVNLKDDSEEINKDSLEDLLLENNIDVGKEDYETLKKMIKHNMPLSRENISKVKTIIDFKNKILSDSSEEDNFILKYTSNKNIDINNEQGKNIQRILKGFFSELKGLSEDDIFTMLENNIEFTEENIKSFKKLVNEDSIIYKEVKSIQEKADGREVNKQPAEVEVNKTALNSNQERNNYKLTEEKRNEAHSLLKVLESDIKQGNISKEDLKLYESLKKLIEDDGSAASNIKLEEVTHGKTERLIPGYEGDKVDEEIVNQNDKPPVQEPKHYEDKLKSAMKMEKGEMEAVVKEQLSSKIEDMKTVIKNVLKEEMDGSSETFSKILGSIKENINDFKVFNSLSNQYYFMDIPINLNKDEYPCKLIIKDDRKSGKKIDSKNVSLVVSVKTVNIGIVDAYVKVREQNMSIDIKCEESSINVLSSGKNIILSELRQLGYNAFIDIEKKQAEATISNCSDFFEDSGINSINTRV